MGADSSWPSNALCLRGHAGPMCELCVDTNRTKHDAYFDKTDGRCKDCPTSVGASLLVGSVVGLVAMASVLWCSQRQCHQFQNIIKRGRRWRITKLLSWLVYIVSVAVRVL
jgi:hypothetical protein